MAILQEKYKSNMFSSKEILEQIKEYYGITHFDEDDNIRKKIQRYMKDNNINYIQGKKRERLYSSEAVEDLLDSATIRKYCRRIAVKSDNYQTNSMVLEEQKKEFQEIKDALNELNESVGLTKSDANLLTIDKFNDKKYLQIEELQALNKQGLILRSDLSEDEEEYLQLFQQHLEENEGRDKMIQQIYEKKKADIMITTIFEHLGFSLDEKRLFQDITNNVYQGDYTTTVSCNTDIELSKDIKSPSPVARRSSLRLANQNSYVKKVQQ